MIKYLLCLAAIFYISNEWTRSKGSKAQVMLQAHTRVPVEEKDGGRAYKAVPSSCGYATRLIALHPHHGVSVLRVAWKLTNAARFWVGISGAFAIFSMVQEASNLVRFVSARCFKEKPVMSTRKGSGVCVLRKGANQGDGQEAIPGLS